MKAVIISVNYGDLLAITLPKSAPQFEHIAIGTSRADKETQEIAAQFPNVTTYVTDDFYANGAKFNKGLVVERLFDIVGRAGWLCVLDADIVLPAGFTEFAFAKNHLTTPYRRMLFNPQDYSDSLDWESVPILKEHGWWGYCQVFHADDPVLESRPWYPGDWAHAGGCDHDFQNRWRRSHKCRVPFEVLHLGEGVKNWCGRATVRSDGSMPTSHEQHKANMDQLLEHRKNRREWHLKDEFERVQRK